jgi:hypothetical protein
MADDLGRATLVRNPEYERNGLKSYVRALQKYGITPTVEGPFSGRPGEVQVGLRALFDRILGRTDLLQVEDVEHNTLYIAEVGIGTPPQTVKLNFDTGSADTWV